MPALWRAGLVRAWGAVVIRFVWMDHGARLALVVRARWVANLRWRWKRRVSGTGGMIRLGPVRQDVAVILVLLPLAALWLVWP